MPQPGNGIAEDVDASVVSDPSKQRLTREDGLSSTIDRLVVEAQEMLPSNKHRPLETRLRDITTSFVTHTSNLQPGELVKDEFFTLFEAVGALEIMDPKMDSGFIPEGDSFGADFDPAAPLEAGEVLWIMDELMCLEIEWLEGYPLSQTVFSSLHVDRLLAPDNWSGLFRLDRAHEDESVEDVLTQHILRAYCISLVKCLEASSAVIQGQTFYEEEDFVTHLFGRELLPRVTVDEAFQALEEANHSMKGAEPLSEELRGALEGRLLFQEQMLDALRGSSFHWVQMLEGLEEIQSSHSHATSVPNAFSSKVQRQLATSTPPRPMLNVSWDKAMIKWRQVITDALEAYHLTSINVISDPQCLQRATWSFAYRNPTPGTLPRAILQDQLFLEQGPVATGVGHYELFLSDLRNVVLAGDTLVDPASFQVELPSDPRHARSRLVEQFIEKAFDGYLNLYRMLCQNRCRIRRLFTQAIAILDALESEGARVDQAIANVPTTSRGRDAHQKNLRPLSSWAKLYKLNVMMWTAQMGFETELYMDDELGSMYWYLSYLAASQAHLVEHIRTHLQQRMKSKLATISDCTASLTWLNSARLTADIKQALSAALSTFFFHLQSLGVIASPKRDFSRQQLFYEARMKPYLSVSNDVIPSLADFSKAREAYNGRSTSEVCEEIDDKINSVKKNLVELKRVDPEEGKYVGTEEQYKKEIKALETTCVAIAVNASQLSRLCKKYGDGGMEGKVQYAIEKKWHEWWVVPVLREKD